MRRRDKSKSKTLDGWWLKDGDAIATALDEGRSHAAGGGLTPAFASALLDSNQPDDEELNKSCGKGVHCLTLSLYRNQMRWHGREVVRLRELRAASKCLKHPVESLQMQLTKLSRAWSSEASLGAAARTRLQLMPMLHFAHNSPKQKQLRREEAILWRRFVAKTAKLLFEVLPAELRAAQGLFLEHNVRFPRTTQRSRFGMLTRKQQASLRLGRPEGEPPVPADAPVVILDVDSCPGGSRMPTAKLREALRGLAETSPRYAERVSVMVVDGYRSTKQAAPAHTLFTGQRCDRVAPTAAHVAQPQHHHHHLPHDCFDKLWDPLLKKFVQRDWDVPMSLAGQRVLCAVGRPAGQYARQPSFTVEAPSLLEVAAFGAKSNDPQNFN